MVLTTQLIDTLLALDHYEFGVMEPRLTKGWMDEALRELKTLREKDLPNEIDPQD